MDDFTIMEISFIRQKVKSGEYDLSEHAHKERQVEGITTFEIERTLLNGDIIEQYPNDPRGGSCFREGSIRSLRDKRREITCSNCL